ncbi:MAG TPA: acetyl-CoA carboxylase biotin carboxyl carrier protein subunit [Burkholderiaceae bacterium]|nr:acetyl-CoA carboxylase biotin carboxyl carrier protein subunit [Burkholderiaceae bacterium]
MKRLLSPVSGILRTYLVDVGAHVTPDTEIALVESMKMEIPVLAESSGRVTALLADPSSMIEEGQPLLELGV